MGRAARRVSLAATLAYLPLMAALTSCEADPDAPESALTHAETVHVLLIGPPDDSRWEMIVRGAENYARQIERFELETIASRGYDPEVIPVFRGTKTRPSAAIIWVSQPDAAAPLVEKLLSESILVVSVGTPLGRPAVFGHVDIHVAGAVEALAQRLPELLHGRRSYVLLHEDGASPITTRTYRRFSEQARRQREVTQLIAVNAHETRKPPEQLVREMLSQFRHAGLVITLEPSCWLAMSPDQIADLPCGFATVGTVPELWPYLRDGRAVALVGTNHGQVGQVAMRTVVEGLSAGVLPGVIHTVEGELITAENLDDFVRRYAEAVGASVSELWSRAASTQPSRAEGGG